MGTDILSSITAVFGTSLESFLLGAATMSPLNGHASMPPALNAAAPMIRPPSAVSPLESLSRRATPPKTSSARIKEHLVYLRDVSTKGVHPPISRDTAASAWQAWMKVWEASGFALPVPAACTGPDGQLLYAWDSGEHHLELEFIPGQPAEFFYRNRETGDLWGEDYSVADPLPPEAIQKLKLFV